MSERLVLVGRVEEAGGGGGGSGMHGNGGRAHMIIITIIFISGHVLLMNKSLVIFPLGKLGELLLLEHKLLGLVFTSLIWTIMNKVSWAITIVAFSSSK